MVVLPLMGTDNHWYLSHANLANHAKFFPHADSFSHTNLTNLTDGASLRPRLSALPSVHIPEESTSDSKCSSWDLWDLCEPNQQDLAFAFFAWSAWSQNHPRVKELERLLNLISTAKLQLQNPNVNTLNASALVNNLGGSFAKNGTIDYLCWAKRKMFLLASRNVSNCK